RLPSPRAGGARRTERSLAPTRLAHRPHRSSRARRPFGPHAATTEEQDEVFEHFSVPLVLIHVKDRMELPPASSSCKSRVAMDGDGKASLPVDEAHDPERIEPSSRPVGFLLIVRTGRIVTAHVRTLRRGCNTDEYRRILGCSSIQPGFITARYQPNRYSYGRRLPGLRFRASPLRTNPSP